MDKLELRHTYIRNEDFEHPNFLLVARGCSYEYSPVFLQLVHAFHYGLVSKADAAANKTRSSLLPLTDKETKDMKCIEFYRQFGALFRSSRRLSAKTVGDLLA